MNLIRKLLLPLVPLYYAVTWLRNIFYDLGWTSSKSYDLPIICVGNLSTGGTGKTPTIEYLIRLLKEDYKLATLSRGYKRETSGFIIADKNATARTIGDEPFQFYKKFESVTVCVDANRQHGISQLINLKNPDIILLDDAFQHRKVKAGLYILLTAYDNLYSSDMLLPTGNLREPKSGARRADIILVTKCPFEMSTLEKERIIEKLKPLNHQDVYFSSISYSDMILSQDKKLSLNELKGKTLTLVTGIANPKPLMSFLKSQQIEFEHLNYKDHHEFSASDIKYLKTKDCILTTEKDYVRLVSDFKSVKTPLYYLPISFKIDKHTAFDDAIKKFVESS